MTTVPRRMLVLIGTLALGLLACDGKGSGSVPAISTPSSTASLVPNTAPAIKALIDRRWREAEELFTVVLAMQPDNSSALARRAIARSELGDPDGAIADVRRSLEISETADGLAAQGYVLAKRDDVAGAESSFSEALRLDPNMPAALTYRAKFYFDQGNYEESIQDYDRALATPFTTPTFPYLEELELLSGRGLAHAARGEASDAIADLVSALSSTRDSAVCTDLKARAAGFGITVPTNCQ